MPVATHRLGEHLDGGAFEPGKAIVLLLIRTIAGKTCGSDGISQTVSAE